MKQLWRMEKEKASELEILKAENEAMAEIIESLPVDAHDMDVHFWCRENSWCSEDEVDGA